MPQYKVIIGSSIREVAMRVEEIMIGGWFPQGGISFDGVYYLQAMIWEK